MAAWQPGMVSIAAPLTAPDRTIYSLNISFPSSDAEIDAQVARYAPKLLRLAKDIAGAWQAGERETR